MSQKAIKFEKVSDKLFYVDDDVWDEKPITEKIKISVDPKQLLNQENMDKVPIPSDPDRGGWGHQLDFLFSCISLSVGLGNVWRFPYLCYKNGGGVFLITYTVSMFLCGIPLFFQEVAIGQYLGSGGMTFIGQLCPILKGVGYATMTIVFLLDVYYCVIIAWTLFYILSLVMYLPKLPWEGCDNWWNSQNNCFTADTNVTLFGNGTKKSPVEEYFENRVLGITSDITEVGNLQWTLFICLILGWIIVYAIIRKGLHQSGKIIWFSALFPYAVLLILMGRAVTLTGALNGLLYYVTPKWEELLTPGPWMDGATQIFFAYSIGCGALPALGSYNKFHHNSYKDAMITCVVNTLTSLMAGIVTFSILGHLAYEKGDNDVANVVKSGPGLVFLTYPEVVLKLPGAPFWAAIFFIMLLILGIDSQFCLVEAFITGILDNWSQELRPYRVQFTTAVCIVMFLLGIPMVMEGGMYIFQLMDFYSASGISLLWVCFFQTVGLSWVFGVEKFSDCVEQMLGFRPGIFWQITWKYLAPAVMVTIFISQCWQFETLSYGDYKYPNWANVIGFGISLMSMVWIPLYAIFYLIKGPKKTLHENLKLGMKSTINPRKVSEKEKRLGFPVSDSNVGLLTPSSKQFLSEMGT